MPFLEQCASVEYLPEGGLILREIYGYGPGIKADKPTLEALDHNGMGLESLERPVGVGFSLQYPTVAQAPTAAISYVLSLPGATWRLFSVHFKLMLVGL